MVLLGLLVVSVSYYALDQSAMNQAKMKQSLASHNVYQLVRTEEVIPQLVGRSPVELGDSGIFTKADLLKSLEQVITEEKVKTWGGQVTDITYEWLNKKRPDLTFSIDMSQEKQQLLADLSSRVNANVKNLPECTTQLAASDVWREWTCLPYYVTVTEVANSVNGELTSSFSDLNSTITNEDVGLTARQLGAAVNLPDYYGYLWALNFVTLPLAALIALYLIVKRRGAGLIAIGAAVLFAALLLLVGGNALGRFATASDPLQQAVLQSAYGVMSETIGLYTPIGLTGGIILITLGILLVLRKRQIEQVSEQSQTSTTE